MPIVVPHIEDSFLNSIFLQELSKPLISKTTRSESADLTNNCFCDSMCHERLNSHMHTNMKYIKEVYRRAITKHWDNQLLINNNMLLYNLALNETTDDHIQIIAKHGSISISKGKTNYNVTREYHHPTIELPAVPDVAIHYRCGDNVVSHYGFLPFRVYLRHIPKTARHIYIMAESATRKVKHGSVSRCAHIFDALQKFLNLEFPDSAVVVLRGQSLLDDFARLTFANITFCSVSTFCLWPAVGSNNIAYVPIVKLFARERTDFDYGPSFHWLNGTDERAILGQRVIHMADKDVVKLLMAP